MAMTLRERMIATLLLLLVGAGATILRAQASRAEVEAALERGEVPAQLLGYRAPELPDPATLPAVQIKGSTARLAAYGHEGASAGLLATTTLPAKFDLRDEGFVTPPRNQSPWGTCWMFASMGSFESCLLKMYGERADFSEWNCLTANLWPGRDILNAGGSSSMAASLMMTLFGPPLEVQDPYQTATSPSLAHAPKPAARLLQAAVSCYPPYDTATETYDTFDADYVREIKTLIYTYGAVTSAYYHDVTYYNAAKAAYYHPTASTTNHAILLIGWDDTFSKSNFKNTPSRDGAWLIKNSWGSHCDYFYISYDDPAINSPGSIYQFRPLSPALAQDIGRLYQYDGGKATSYWYSSRVTARSLGALFTAQGNERLCHVAFYNWQPAGDTPAYTLAIYADPTEGIPSSGTLLTKQSGTITFPNQQLIPLATPVLLTKGQRFSIVLSLTSSNGSPLRYAVNDTTNLPGCTFVAATATPTATTRWSDTASNGNLFLHALTAPGPTATNLASLMDWLKAAGYARESAVASALASAAPAAETAATTASYIDYERAVSEMQADASTASGLTPLECYLAGTLPDEELTLIPRLTFDDAGAPLLSPDPELPGRDYTLYSKATLSDAWTTDADLSDKHFFKYRVSWPAATTAE